MEAAGKQRPTTMEEKMARYHEYLEKNYEGGCERFFSPTGFLEAFQKSVTVRAERARNHVLVRSIDEAVSKLEPAVAGGEGVFDLTAEPGTGKTSVLPFRFPSKRVIVALPTPFDAWNAFNMATGPCSLRLKGLSLGDKNSSVTYTDSYMATHALLANYLDYDVLIVDECDSDRGVSKCLAEVKTKGKLLIRMSATHGRKTAGLSSAFRTTETHDMPDVRQGTAPVANYVKERYQGRALLLAPDAAVAAELHQLLPGSTLVTVGVRLDVIAKTMAQQEGDGLYVSDDTCGRAVNLNLDAMFDCQLVSEYGAMRVLTPEELVQRKNRVGRNRPGWYYSPGVTPVAKGPNDFDIVRHNVVRSVSGIDQLGDDRLRVTEAEASDLACCPAEPYSVVMRKRAESSAVTSSSGSSSRGSSRAYDTPPRSRAASVRSRASSVHTVEKVKAPEWLAYFNGYTSKSTEASKAQVSDVFVVKNAKGRLAFERRKSSDSSSGTSGDRSIASVVRSGHSSSAVVSHRARPQLPVAEGAPYAVDRRVHGPAMPVIDLPDSPPVMDLTQLTYDLDWPRLVRDRLARGGDLPSIVPNGSWRHTSAGGLGTDWFRRLDDMATRDNTFADDEFEVVARAWNKLVAQAWVKRTPGLSNVSDAARFEYCVRYFQAWFTNGTIG